MLPLHFYRDKESALSPLVDSGRCNPQKNKHVFVHTLGFGQNNADFGTDEGGQRHTNESVVVVAVGSADILARLNMGSSVYQKNTQIIFFLCVCLFPRQPFFALTDDTCNNHVKYITR